MQIRFYPRSFVLKGLMIVVLGLCLGVVGPRPASAQLFGSDSEAQKRTAEQSLRINQLEGQIRQMNGQIEQMGYQVKQLNDLIIKMQKDYEFRLQDLENGGQAKKPAQPMKKSEAPMPGDPQPSRLMAQQPQADAIAPAGVAQMAPPVAAPPAIAQGGQMAGGALAAPRPGPGAPPAMLGQLSSNDPIGGVIGGAPMDLAPAAQPKRSTVTINGADADEDGMSPPGVNLGPTARTAPPAAPARDPRPVAAAAPAPVQAPAPAAARGTGADDYDVAYNSMLNGDYAQAEAGFKSFLMSNPTDNRAASSQYWLGESFYSRKMYREAADAFLTSYQQYPTSQKAADSLLKLGLSLEGLGEKKAACASFNELLAKYPKASKAIRDLATAEKTRAKCA